MRCAWLLACCAFAAVCAPLCATANAGAAAAPRVAVVPLPKELYGPALGEWCRPTDPQITEAGLEMGPLGCMLLQRLEASPYFEPDPEKADYFLIPGGGMYKGRAAMLRLFAYLRAEWPYWNRTVAQGTARHLLVATFDSGAGEAFDWPKREDDIPEDINPLSVTRNVVYLQHNGMRDVAEGLPMCASCFQPGKDVMIPTSQAVCGPLCGYSMEELRATSPWKMQVADLESALTHKRQHTLFFGGSVPDKSADDFTGRGGMYLAHADRDGFHIPSSHGSHHEHVDFAKIMRDAEFCYSPLGSHGGDTDRYVAAILFACVPVLINTSHMSLRIPHSLPLEEVLPWETFSTVVNTADVPLLHKQLECLMPSVPSMRRTLSSVWPRMLWSSLYGSYLGERIDADASGGSGGDAFDTLMEVLARRIPHGYRAPPEVMTRLLHPSSDWPCTSSRSTAQQAPAVSRRQLSAR